MMKTYISFTKEVSSCLQKCKATAPEQDVPSASASKVVPGY